jgi:putative endonuclease
MTRIYKESAFAGAKPVRAARQRRGKQAYLSGQAAEEQIARDYERRGFAVERRRWRGRQGEIDLVVRDGAALIFVEVKASSDFARAAESLRPAQMRRISGAAEEYLAGEPQELLTETRFDVALVDGGGAVEILENAFGQF